MEETKQQGDQNRRTNRNIILSVGATLVAKLMVLLQSSVISAVFGANEEVDIIFYMMGLIVTVTTFASAVNQLVIVANVIKAKDERPAAEYRGLVRFFFTLYLVVGAAIFALIFFFGRQVIGLLTAFPPEAVSQNLPMIRVMAGVLFLSVVNTFMMDVFTSYRVFILPMVNDVVKSLFIILFILIPGKTIGIGAIALGMLAAYLVQFATISLSFRRMAGFWMAPGLPCKLGKGTKKNAVSVLLAQTATSAESMTMMGIVSTFPAGYYVAMSLARKLFTAVMNVLIMQFATVVGIDLIEHNATGNPEKLSSTFTGYLKTASWLILPVMAVSMVNAPAIISLLFGYGRFTQENVLIAANLLRVLSLSMLTFLWDSFLQRLVVAKQLNHKTFVFQIGQSLLRISMYFTLIHLFGYLGVALGLVLGNLAYDIAVGLYLFRGPYRFIKLKNTFAFLLANILFAGLAAGAGVLCLRFYTPGMGFVGNLLYLCATSLVIFGVYIGAGLLYKPNRNTLSIFTQMLARRKKAKKADAAP